MYKSASPEAGSPPDGGAAAGSDQPVEDKNDDVVDAEFVDVDDKK
jgi:hypothetical protein